MAIMRLLCQIIKIHSIKTNIPQENTTRDFVVILPTYVVNAAERKCVF